CQEDDDVRVLIITGKGRGFSSGHDVSDLVDIYDPKKLDPSKPLKTPEPASSLPLFLHHTVEKPIIGAINGVCAGAGYCMALACDVRIASENARFVHAYLRRALIASGELWWLPRIIGLGPTLYRVFTSDDILAEEALELKMVSKVVPADKLDEEAYELASQVALAPPTTVKFIKKAIYRGLTHDFESTMEFVGYARELAKMTGETSAYSKNFVDKTMDKFWEKKE
ncbi:enoyl-CoA hydratase/isomerase family protein, partial [Chloroflexota bacterium]